MQEREIKEKTAQIQNIVPDERENTQPFNIENKFSIIQENNLSNIHHVSQDIKKGYSQCDLG